MLEKTTSDFFSNDNNFEKKQTKFPLFNFNAPLKHTEKLPEILFITSYPPRECGIATYSQDLINALNNQFENTFECSICALESENEIHNYNQKPQYILNTDLRNSFTKMAFKINKNKNIKLVVMQHEFGFFSKKENEFILLFENIKKPIVFVFHTVLPKPNAFLKEKVQQMASIASSVIVMTNNASKILTEQYSINALSITIIPHGTHLVPSLDKVNLKKKYSLLNKKILSTFGLLSSGKGIEVTLNALPKIVSQYPDVIFLVLGKTHPSVVKNDGEEYRKMLEKKVIDLNLSTYVHFINEYLPLNKLLEYLQLTDIYLFTSKNPEQAVSGTFSYAVSCGCPLISTPIPHAVEVLDNGAGIIIDFENHKQLSQSVIKLLGNKQSQKNISLNGLRKMASTSWQNTAIAHATLFENLNPNTFYLKYRIPNFNLDHVKKMTTNFGIIQFSKIAQPDIKSGYTLDDNARALIAICYNYETFKNANDLILIRVYLQFIK